MALDKMFRELKEELKQYIIDHPKTNFHDIAQAFGWSPYQERIMMTAIKGCAGVNGNEYFLHITKLYYDPDNPAKRYNICSEAGYAKKHNLPENEHPHAMTKQQKADYQNQKSIIRQRREKLESKVEFDRVLDVNTNLWPAPKGSL